MKDDALFFLHIFTHSRYAYPYEVCGDGGWMAQHFFTSGIMPSDTLLEHLEMPLRVREHWRVNGVHYRKTANAWLSNMDSQKRELLPLLAKIYSREEARR